MILSYLTVRMIICIAPILLVIYWVLWLNFGTLYKKDAKSLVAAFESRRSDNEFDEHLTYVLKRAKKYDPEACFFLYLVLTDELFNACCEDKYKSFYKTESVSIYNLIEYSKYPLALLKHASDEFCYDRGSIVLRDILSEAAKSDLKIAKLYYAITALKEGYALGEFDWKDMLIEGCTGLGFLPKDEYLQKWTQCMIMFLKRVILDNFYNELKYYDLLYLFEDCIGKEEGTPAKSSFLKFNYVAEWTSGKEQRKIIL